MSSLISSYGLLGFFRYLFTFVVFYFVINLLLSIINDHYIETDNERFVMNRVVIGSVNAVLGIVITEGLSNNTMIYGWVFWTAVVFVAVLIFDVVNHIWNII